MYIMQYVRYVGIADFSIVKVVSIDKRLNFVFAYIDHYPVTA